MKNRLHSFLSILLMFIAISFQSLAQETGLDTAKINSPEKELEKYEDTLVQYADSLRNGLIIKEKAHYNEQFVLTLRRALALPQSFNYPFDHLKQYIHIITPEDKSFRIFNWLVLLNEFERRYYGAIQMNNKEMTLYPLLDYSGALESSGRALDQVSNKEWYGGEIYNIYKLPKVTENGQAVYAIFSYNNSAVYSKKKILDHLVITENGPIFGLPIINTPNGTVNRFILEYKKDAFVNLNFNKEENKIIFDQTASDIGDPSKKFTFVPTGHLDGFKLVNGKWEFIPDAIPVLKLKDGNAPIDGVFPNN